MAYLSEKICGKDLVLHSDNGSPMKGATMLVTLQNFGVIPSFSRPSVSNDNPYSEALFKTLKYTPIYPSEPFDTIETVRTWVLSFVRSNKTPSTHSSSTYNIKTGFQSTTLPTRLIIALPFTTTLFSKS